MALRLHAAGRLTGTGLLLLAAGIARAEGEAGPVPKIKIKSQVDVARERAARIGNVKAVQTLTLRADGETVTMNIAMQYKPPRKYRTSSSCDAFPGMNTLVVSNGEVLWMRVPVLGWWAKVDKSRLRSVFGEEHPLFSAESGLDRCWFEFSDPFRGAPEESIRYAGMEFLEGVDCYVFELEPLVEPQMVDQFAEIMPDFLPAKGKMWLGKRDGMVRKIVILDDTGSEVMRSIFSDIELNTNLDDALFEYSPEPSDTVMDFTDFLVESIKEMDPEDLELFQLLRSAGETPGIGPGR